MLKFLRLPVATYSAIFISSLLFSPVAGVTQEHSGCFMVTSSGQVVNLDNICVNEKILDQDYQSKTNTVRNSTDDLNRESVASHNEEETSRSFKESEAPNVVSVGPDGTKYYSNGDQLLPNGTIRRVRFGN